MPRARLVSDNLPRMHCVQIKYLFTKEPVNIKANTLRHFKLMIISKLKGNNTLDEYGWRKREGVLFPPVPFLTPPPRVVVTFLCWELVFVLDTGGAGRGRRELEGNNNNYYYYYFHEDSPG